MSAATSTRIAAGVTTAYLRDLARRPAPAMSARARRRGEGSAFRAPDFTRDISDAPCLRFPARADHIPPVGHRSGVRCTDTTRRCPTDSHLQVGAEGSSSWLSRACAQLDVATEAAPRAGRTTSARRDRRPTRASPAATPARETIV
jgi:hypothetical protein